MDTPQHACTEFVENGRDAFTRNSDANSPSQADSVRLYLSNIQGRIRKRRCISEHVHRAVPEDRS